MLFNSFDFAFFLPLVFGIYWIFKSKRHVQNLVLLIASYVFYGWWKWEFLTLIAFSSLVDYRIGILLGKSKIESRRKWLLACSILVNIGLLAFFKYSNFFLDNFVAAFQFFGMTFNPDRLSIILPVGISFYTFQTLSYSIDVYRRKLEPTRDPITFFAFVSFFPQLVAGPIERATNLLPQFKKERTFDYHSAVDGSRHILWGLFKKIAVADTCAVYVNDIFSNYESLPGSTLVLGVILFSIQIYCDFSGYSDIAIGTGRLFGFDLMKNFHFPYFSRDIGEFWRRWHISLSTWFRDYVYIPLGGSRVSKLKVIRNVLVIFLVSGFWHGANWTFIAWGLLHAIYFVPLVLLGRNRNNLGEVSGGHLFVRLKELPAIILTFTLTTFAWIFFRSESITDAFAYIGGIVDRSLFDPLKLDTLDYIKLSILLSILFVFEWIQRAKEHALQFDNAKIHRAARWAIYYVLILIMTWIGGQQTEFIYFQF